MLQALAFFTTLFLITCSTIQATYIQVYSKVDNGALSWTGNTLGLNKAANQNSPGTQGSIGAFISLNPTTGGTFPLGTTLNWEDNGSSAELDLPEGSTILHAELIWSGSYGFNPAISGAVLNSTVNLITPDNITHVITPNPATAQSRPESSGRGFYVRSQDVTAILSSLVESTGTYSVGHVPGTVVATENNSNCCGWTLAVAYQNPLCLTSDLNLYVACEASGAAAALVSGFHAPDTGAITSRLFVSALEGDAQSNGDRLLVGASLPLSYPADRVFGTNNAANNFFASQINTLLPLTKEVVSGKLLASGSSLLDTRGTFGNINSLSSGTSVTGARQGYDITSVDLGTRVVNGQTELYVQGLTAGEGYTINALGVAIEVQAPIIQSTKTASVSNVNIGDTVTFTFQFQNIGESAATNVIFKDLLPTGLVYSGNFVYGATPVLVPDLVNGVSIGNLAPGASINVSFDVLVTSIPPPFNFVNVGEITYDFVPIIGNPPITLTSATNEVNLSGILVPPVAVNDSAIAQADTPYNGESVLDNDSGTMLTIFNNDLLSTQGATVSMFPDGTYFYVPVPGYSGADSFNYTAKDPLNQQTTATVNIVVLPLARGDEDTVAANTILTSQIDVRANDSGTGLQVTPFVNNPTDFGGTVTLLATGIFTYNPPLDFVGQDTFNYTVTDSFGSTSTATVTINVIAAAQNDFGTTPANTPLDGETVFSNDTGVGVITSYQNPSSQGGAVIMDVNLGTYTYLPPFNFSGIDTFTYTVNGSLIATVTITVLPVAVDDVDDTCNNTPITGGPVLANDIGTGLTVQSYEPMTLQGGTVVMDLSTGTYDYNPPFNFTGIDIFTYTIVDAAGSTSTATVTVNIALYVPGDIAATTTNVPLIGQSVILNDTGSALQVISSDIISAAGGIISMNADGTYQYIPPLNFSGFDSFEYTTIDGQGNINSSLVAIDVFPLVLNENVSTFQNTPLAGNVLLNDRGTLLTVTDFQSPTTQGGTIVLNVDGSFVYTPPGGFVGVDSFTYQVTDEDGLTGTGVVTITVLPIPPPLDFVGKIKKCHFISKTTYLLKSSWTVGNFPDTVFYRIYLNNQVVSVIPAAAPLVFEACLTTKNNAGAYQITAVNSFNAESARVQIRIVP